MYPEVNTKEVIKQVSLNRIICDQEIVHIHFSISNLNNCSYSCTIYTIYAAFHKESHAAYRFLNIKGYMYCNNIIVAFCVHKCYLMPGHM